MHTTPRFVISSKEHLTCRIKSSYARHIEKFKIDELCGLYISGFRIDALISEGGHAKVYLAHDKEGSKKAIKLMKSDFLGNTTVENGFRIEYALTSNNWKNVVKTQMLGQLKSGQIYLVQEFLEGISACSLIDPIAPKLAFEIGIAICDALIDAQAIGCVHRDIKERNIMLIPNPLTSEFQIRLIDWEIAKLLDNTNQKSLSNPTPLYSPPEWIQSQTVDVRSDIYSLGIVLYRLISMLHPYKFKEFPASINELLKSHTTYTPEPLAGIPMRFSQVILKAMNKSMIERFQTTQEFKTALVEAKNFVDG